MFYNYAIFVVELNPNLKDLLIATKIAYLNTQHKLLIKNQKSSNIKNCKLDISLLFTKFEKWQATKSTKQLLSVQCALHKLMLLSCQLSKIKLS
jgi:hypothetical protein